MGTLHHHRRRTVSVKLSPSQNDNEIRSTSLRNVRYLSAAVILCCLIGSALLWWTYYQQPKLAMARARVATVTINVLVAEASHDPVSGGKPVLYRATNGSGFFVDRAGNIVTNAHVVQSAVRIEVEYADGTRRMAKMIGADRLTDIAVIRVTGATPPPVTFATTISGVGDSVFAVGSPFGLTGSLSTGLVSGVDRALRPSAGNWLIQHTALIDPGSSGGPVFNMAGAVIGVNSAFPDSQFEFSGISFAVEAGVAAKIAREIIATGKVSRAEIGATFRAIDGLMAISAGLPTQRSVIVSAVEASSPASRGGLLPGDIITKLDNKPVAGLSWVVRSIVLADSKRHLSLTVVRNGKTKNLKVRPRAQIISPRSPTIASEDVGVMFSEAGPVVVTKVRALSRAAVAGIEPGDTVSSINLRPVADSQDARRMLARSGPFVTLGVTRAGSLLRLVVLGAEASAQINIAGNDRGTSNADL
jgi:serine protease Do